MALNITRYETVESTAQSPELVLIHGWGSSQIIWQSWLELLRSRCNVSLIDLPGYGNNADQPSLALEQLLIELDAILPERCIVIGYSLGGMLAVKLAEQYPDKVAAIISLSSNTRFVASPSWPDAMAQEDYKNFYSLVEKNTTLALKRFSGFQTHGAQNEKELIKQLRLLREESATSPQVLLSSLDLLASINNSDAITRLNIPALYLFGEKDSLVPAKAANKIEVSSSSEIKVLSDLPHCLFYADPIKVWKIIESFLVDNKILSATEKLRLEKKQVAKSFSRAAQTYDSVAALQRRVGRRLIQLLPVDKSATTIVDLGCGTGFFSENLSQQYSKAQLLGIDLAEGMVAYAKSERNLQTAQWLCGDAEQLPLADNSADIIFSSLAIQWCENNIGLFDEVFRVLKPGGCFVFSTLGPETLQELRTAWYQVDDFVHVNRFAESTVLNDAVNAAGFSVIADTGFIQEEKISLEFDTLKQLTRELKSLGAHNVNAGRAKGLTGKKRMQAFVEAYEQQRNSADKLPATYQVWYGRLIKPASSYEASEGGVAYG